MRSLARWERQHDDDDDDDGDGDGKKRLEMEGRKGGRDDATEARSEDGKSERVSLFTVKVGRSVGRVVPSFHLSFFLSFFAPLRKVVTTT